MPFRNGATGSKRGGVQCVGHGTEVANGIEDWRQPLAPFVGCPSPRDGGGRSGKTPTLRDIADEPPRKQVDRLEEVVVILFRNQGKKCGVCELSVDPHPLLQFMYKPASLPWKRSKKV